MNEKIEELLKEHLSADEAKIALDFLNRGFSFKGQVAIASIFVFAHEQKKDVNDVLACCEHEWKKNWNIHHPDLRGDPDAPGKAGFNNVVSIEDIYNKLGIPIPPW